MDGRGRQGPKNRNKRAVARPGPRSCFLRTFGWGNVLADRSYLVGVVGSAVLTAPDAGKNAKAIRSLCRRSERVGATVSPQSAGGVGWPQSQGALPRLELIRRDWSHPNEDRPAT